MAGKIIFQLARKLAKILALAHEIVGEFQLYKNIDVPKV